MIPEHLSLDLVVAFADGELSTANFQRAAAHVARCAQCANEVAEQHSARELLRSALGPKMPGSLFEQLRSIPLALPNPAHPSNAVGSSPDLDGSPAPLLAPWRAKPRGPLQP